MEVFPSVCSNGLEGFLTRFDGGRPVRRIFPRRLKRWGWEKGPVSDVVRCNDQRSVLRRPMQRAAMADAAQCVICLRLQYGGD